ncbi:MAG TPA: hypothetical protein DEG17_12435 [Cyanobacteria bacterium UBA11149]|nr:hypothetical protein [Cyanobacteria bacterium UBA11367]HBE59992.1 hypothetical protein [Cyanobacteria bacterium UBA11366]HBK63946.1 hypothetical protein [Cyanobacteria bacterium UBA11166]HBR75248.1 hypothetical protein [Cyanobacteria bacterium UBA11159]HBS70510.1 hypothetical protein [Cyanobacteria bacterium UBA11153]HBW89653.1 hypothetical protein [Cyanobacteria bacterium UBA11149]HCA96812.1 hypothetical protein [Cyanobacteria bacterium UBA9226]
MWQNEILDEIHKIREEHAKSFNYDLDAMFADWQKKQAESGREVVSLLPKSSLIPTLRGLPRADKLKVMQFLIAELAKEEEQNLQPRTTDFLFPTKL